MSVIPCYADYHNGQGCIQIARSAWMSEQDGVGLVRTFFSLHGRQQRAWTSVDAARAIQVPAARLNAAFRDARDEGLVELGPDGWRWVG